MVNPLRTKDGKFAGSVGNGKTKTPTSTAAPGARFAHPPIPYSPAQAKVAYEMFDDSDSSAVVQARASQKHYRLPSYFKTFAVLSIPGLPGRWRNYRKNGAIVFAIRRNLVLKGKLRNITILEDMSVDPDWRCRDWAAAQENLPPYLAEILASDESRKIRYTLSHNLNVPDYVKTMLTLSDPDFLELPQN